jgi:hypothetical protein
MIVVPRPLGEIVREILARGDDSAWTMPQESRGAWSEGGLAGWRADLDVTAQLAALTSLDLSKHELVTRKYFDNDQVKRMLGVRMLMYSVFIPLSVLK